MEQNGKKNVQRAGQDSEAGEKAPVWVGLAHSIVVCATIVAIVWILWGGC